MLNGTVPAVRADSAAAESSRKGTRPKRYRSQACAVTAQACGALVPGGLSSAEHNAIRNTIQAHKGYCTRERVTVGEWQTYTVWALPTRALTFDSWRHLLAQWPCVLVRHSIGDISPFANGSGAALGAKHCPSKRRNELAKLRLADSEMQQVALHFFGESLPDDWRMQSAVWEGLRQQYRLLAAEQRRDKLINTCESLKALPIAAKLQDMPLRPKALPVQREGKRVHADALAAQEQSASIQEDTRLEHEAKYAEWLETHSAIQAQYR